MSFFSEPMFMLATAIFSITGVLAVSRRAMDALSLVIIGVVTAMFAVVAFEKALTLGHSAAIATVMGVLTRAGGGLIRDVITGHETILLRRELYITPILASAAAFFAAREWAPWTAATTATVAMGVGAMIRCGSLWRGWTFPYWLSHRPGG